MRLARPGRLARWVLVGALAVVVLVLAGLIAFGQAYTGRILPGVHIGGVQLGGLTPADARAALAAGLNQLEQGTVTVRSSRGELAIPFDDLERRLDLHAMVESAIAVGRAGTRLDESVAGLRGLDQPVSIAPVLTMDRDRLDDVLALHAARAYRPASDAFVLPTKRGFTVVPAVDGAQFDTTSAADAIEAALLDPATEGSVEVALASQRIAPVTTEADAERAQAGAKRIAANLELAGASKTWLVKAWRIRPWITFSGSGPDYSASVDTSAIPSVLERVARDVERKPTEARFLRDRAGNTFGVTASHPGRALDVERTTAAIEAALTARAAGTPDPKPVAIKTMVVAPELTTEEATRKAPFVVRLGSWTTYYQVSAHNGFAANITIPARKLDGVVVRPGATFDFWKALGEVSFRTGYRLGGAIVGGHTVEGRALAGGICAASTTLFNAAARGGLDIVTRSPHWYYITRYPLGLDATVSDSQTMRFRNDTRHPILIKAYASPGTVRFEIWSVPNGRTVTLSRPSVRNVVRGYDTVKETSALAPGVRERIEWPVDGKDVTVTRTVRDADGRVLHRDVFVSHYHRMVGITLVGR
jgi:vancomycin resistance protein YoaR